MGQLKKYFQRLNFEEQHTAQSIAIALQVIASFWDIHLANNHVLIHNKGRNINCCRLSEGSVKCDSDASYW